MTQKSQPSYSIMGSSVVLANILLLIALLLIAIVFSAVDKTREKATINPCAEPKKENQRKN